MAVELRGPLDHYPVPYATIKIERGLRASCQHLVRPRHRAEQVFLAPEAEDGQLQFGQTRGEVRHFHAAQHVGRLCHQDIPAFVDERVVHMRRVVREHLENLAQPCFVARLPHEPGDHALDAGHLEIDFAGFDTARGHHHQLLHTLRLLQGDVDSHRTAERVAYQHGRAHLQRIEQLEQGGREQLQRVVDALGLGRPAEAEQVRHQHPVAGGGEWADVVLEVAPAVRARTATLNEHHRGAGRRRAGIHHLVVMQAVAGGQGYRTVERGGGRRGSGGRHVVFLHFP